MIYIRARDGQTVSRDEACSSAGQLRSGYSIRVPVIADGQRVTFMDSAATPAALADAALTDARVSHDVARAEATHRTRHAYLGDKAPAFTDAMRDRARATSASAHQQRVARLQDSDGTRHAATVTARVLYDIARAQRTLAVANGWKR